MNKNQLALRLKELRNQKGMSQEVLAEESGLSLRTIQRVENGETNPAGESLKRLSNALNVNPDELIDWAIKEDKKYLTFLNLSALTFLFFPMLGILVPFILWTSKKGKIKNINKLGKNLINFQITWTLILFFIPFLMFLFTKIELLESANIHPFVIHFSEEGIEGNIQNCLANCQTLIVNIPPGLRKNPEHDYVQKMTHLVNAVEQSSIVHVLFIGSTSVYDDDETTPVITERSSTSNSEIALQLLEVEALFQKHKKFKTSVLRFSGLFAEDRHPAKFLSGKTALKNPNAPVNLIHRDDCIAIILQIIKQGIWDEIFNAATTGHPTKKNYYTSVCKMLQIPIPEFKTNAISKGKVIDSTKLVQLLNYDFKVKL